MVHSSDEKSELRDSNPARDRTVSLKSLPRRKERERTRDLDACLRDKAKLRRAYGECLGSQKR